MEKQNKTETLDSDFDFEYSIDELIDKLNAAKTQYGDKYSRLYFYKDCNTDYSFWQLKGEREETDKEFEQRVANQKAWHEHNDAKSFELYKQLKAKFEPEQA